VKREAATFLAGTLGLNAARLVREFLVLGFLTGPGAAAAWVVVSLVRQYGAFSDLGASNALARLLPEAIAKRQDDDQAKLAGSALSLSVASTLALSIAALLALWAVDPSHDCVRAAPWIIAMLALDKVFLIQTTVQRSRLLWGLVASQYVALGVLELVLGSALARHYGLAGALGGTVLAQTVVAVAFWKPGASRMKPVWDPGSVRALTGLGAVLVGFGLTNIAMHSIDRVALVGAGAPASLLTGYHLAAYAAIAVAQVAGGVMGVFSSRLFRASADEPGRYAKALEFPVYGMTAVGLVTGLLALPAVIFALSLTGRDASLPVGALLVLLATEVLACWTMPMENALVGLHRGGRALPARIVGLTLGLFGGIYAWKSGAGALGVAGARLVAQAVVSGAVLHMASKATGVSPVRPVVSLLIPGGLAALALSGASRTGADSAALGIILLAACVLAATVLWSPARRIVESLVRAAPG
jgi:hypothetical protein